MSDERHDAASPPVGHVVDQFLKRSTTFIYTLLRFQRAFRPVVLAETTANLDEFPFGAVRVLRPRDAGLARRGTRRLAARVAGYSTTVARLIADEAERAGCELLHAHFGLMGYRSLAAAQRLDLPLVTTFYGHDLALPDRDEAWRRRYQRLFAGGDLFVCEGPTMATTLARIGCPEEKIRIVRIGLDVEGVAFSPRTPAGKLTVIQTARLIPKKGVDLSLRAFAAARAELGEAELLIVGDGEERERLEALAAELGLGDTVRFLGSLSYAEYQQAMAGADIGLQPSRVAPDGDTEGGAPTVLIEMQAAGLAVLGSRHADLPFVVAHHDGLVEEEDVAGLADGLVRVARLDPERLRKRADEARAFVEREHDARRTGAQIEEVYREALGQPPGRAARTGTTGDRALAVQGQAHA